MQTTLEDVMRQPETLIHTVLTTIVTQEQEKHVRFLNLMLSKIESFMDLYKSASLFNTDTYEKFTSVFNKIPEGLAENEQEDYAVYIHHLLKEGALYGMTQEDPYTVMTLVGSSTAILRELVTEKRRTDLLPLALDMLMLQSIAIAAAGGEALAEKGLTKILKVAQSKEDIEQEFKVTCNHTIYSAVQLRAAICALTLSSVLGDMMQEKKAMAARILAKSMFEGIIENEKFSINPQDKLTATISLAELAAYENKMDDCAKFLEEATDQANAVVKLEDCSVPYTFLASIAFRKKAAYESTEKEDYGEAEHCFERAIELAERCCVAYPNNTHYQDHYGEVLNDVGVLRGITGNFLTSNDAFVKAIENRRKLVDMSKQYNMSLIAVLSNMSMLMQKFGHWEVAKQYLQEAVDLLDAEEHITLPTEAIRVGLKKVLQAIKQHHDPKNKLWVPICGNPNKYGAN